MAARRYGHGPLNPIVGDAHQLLEHFGSLAARGIERSYVWFADMTERPTLEEFGANVICPLTGC